MPIVNDHLSVPVSILRVKKETSLIRTFVFDRSFSFSPGQFVMVWIPGIDEIPMALSSENTITVQKAGDATTAMFALGAGENLGIRGPFGNGFTKGEKVLAIAGGVGAAPLLPLARADCVMTLLLGAKTESELLFVDQLDECTDVLIATDDGSLGQHGFVTALMDDLNLGRIRQDSGLRSGNDDADCPCQGRRKRDCPQDRILTAPLHEMRSRASVVRAASIHPGSGSAGMVRCFPEICFLKVNLAITCGMQAGGRKISDVAQVETD